MTPTLRHSSGFSLIELMIGITVLGVLLGVGVPAFNDIIRNNGLATQTNNLVGALNLARAEAAKRGLPVAVCAASTPPTPPALPTCAAVTTANWQNGWLVFTDRAGTVGVFDGTDELLLTGSAPRAEYQVIAAVTGTTPNPGFTRFNVGTMPVTTVQFTVRPAASAACVKAGRRLVGVAGTGRVTLEKQTCAS